MNVLSSTPNDPRVVRALAALKDKAIAANPVASIESHADEPILVLWMRDDVTDAFGMRSQLVNAAKENRLVSVLIEKVSLPVDIAPHPVVDLVNWRGSPKNVFFGDLVSALRAVAEQTPVPKAKGPASRMLRRFIGGITLTAIMVFLLGFGMNLMALQNNLCSIGFVQPNISDICGAFGLGGKPTNEERLAWEARPQGSCEALRDHVEGFPNGAFHGVAGDMLQARRIIVEESWVPDTQRTIFSQSIAAEGVPDVDTAQAVALEDGQKWAAESCKAFAESDLYRYTSVTLEPEGWDCFEMGSGHYCGFDGYKTCNLERLVRTNYDVCGTSE